MSSHGALMDRVYRGQRHIYDATRKYYLLGRDALIADLAPPAGGSVLEIGCGTGRNLIAVGRAWPGAELFGIDISAAMLEKANASLAKAGIAASLVRGDACDFDPVALFGRPTFDRVFISYALSMIPDWKSAIDASLDAISASRTNCPACGADCCSAGCRISMSRRAPICRSRSQAWRGRPTPRG